ncbi:hypothetical protein [Paenibacillus eucommiae]|uniref:Uncharacterized protein n=1 Tax=Paenibacillus eucommiae TaxID=1355755 RepID=A0ABS4IP65_9BACL|nr:hypothetical protein [Paenibacillus eucommiae]MBP1988721.1 hypothetical protein [Paenibacillus eucommiae]
MIKKLDETSAELFKTWLHDSESTILDVEGKRYLIQPLQNIVQEEIESDPELKQLILQAKKDIANGNVFSTEDILEAIENGDI